MNDVTHLGKEREKIRKNESQTDKRIDKEAVSSNIILVNRSLFNISA